MYAVSPEFIAAARANARQVLLRAYINDVLLTGAELIDLAVTEAVNASDGLAMGATIASKLVMTIKAPDTPMVLAGSKVLPQVALYGVDEWVPLGEFYITKAVSNDDFQTTFTITAYDAFSKTDKPYEPQITMPNTAADILADIAHQCGFSLGLGFQMLNDVLVGQELPAVDGNGLLVFPGDVYTDKSVITMGAALATPAGEFELHDYTCRQYIGYFAGLLGKNARFNRDGKLTFTWYADSGYSIERDFQYMNGCKRLTDQECVVQSITSGAADTTLVAGTGVGITFENPFMTQEVLDEIFTAVAGAAYTPMQVKWRGNPAVEAGDIILVEDYNGDFRIVYAMEQTLRISGGMHSEIKCYGSSDASIAFSTSPTAKKFQRAYTQLQQAIADATKLLNGAIGGVFEVVDHDGDGVNDGWIIHSADNQKFIKATLNGIGLTTNGGATYEQAITPNGINASTINTGTMNAQRISVGDSSLGDVFSVDTDKNGHPVVIIGASDSPIKQKQTNSAITFVNSEDAAVAEFSPAGAAWADLQQIKYCGFVWTKSAATGNVRFTKAGEG